MTLKGWLAKLESRSPETRIVLGLDRVRAVFDRLSIDLTGRRVITVVGTNGKGSVVAFLEALASRAGRRCFAYASPHLVEFGERMRLDGQPATESLIVQALERVELARQSTYLSYFEHVTLAALCVAEKSPAELLILEVGLGGRLDAVNVVDADIAVLTSIGLDHTEWLGPTRLAIGREKIAVGRPGHPLIIGERRLPDGLEEEIRASGVRALRAGRDFRWRKGKSGFSLDRGIDRLRLPMPSLRGAWQLANASCALMAWAQLDSDWSLDEAALADAVTAAHIEGRFQLMADQPQVLVDVAHNPAAARALAEALGPIEPGRRSIAVFSALKEKAVVDIARALSGCFSHWLIAPLPGERGRSGEDLTSELLRGDVKAPVKALESMNDALNEALGMADLDDRIVVFGSFLAVAQVWPTLKTLG